MKNMDEIIQMVGTLGFPIVMCFGVCFMCYKLIMMEREENLNREERLMNMFREFTTKIEELAKIVDSNTRIISICSEKIIQCDSEKQL